jgi:hypothetical protein
VREVRRFFSCPTALSQATCAVTSNSDGPQPGRAGAARSDLRSLFLGPSQWQGKRSLRDRAVDRAAQCRGDARHHRNRNRSRKADRSYSPSDGATCRIALAWGMALPDPAAATSVDQTRAQAHSVRFLQEVAIPGESQESAPVQAHQAGSPWPMHLRPRSSPVSRMP